MSYDPGMYEMPDCGEYVLYHDYAALEAENAKLRAVVDAAQRLFSWKIVWVLRSGFSVLDDKDEIINLAKQLDAALAALQEGGAA